MERLDGYRPKNYFKKEKIVLKVLGISLTANESTTYKIYSFISIFLLNLLYPLLNLRDLFFTDDFDVASRLIAYEFASGLEFVKACVVLRNRLKLRKILNKLENEPFLPDFDRGGKKELKLVRDCVWFTNVQTIAYWIIVIIYICGTATLSLIKRIKSSDYQDWELPYGPFTILNMTGSPYFELVWIYQNISIAWIAIQFATIDVIIASVLAHASFQFKMVQNSFKRIMKNSYYKMLKSTRGFTLNNPMSSNFDYSVVPWKYLNESLNEAVSYHLSVINVVGEIEDILSGLLFITFLSTLGILCFLVYHASVMPLNDSLLLRNIIEGVGAGIQILTACFWGNQIMVESEMVGRAVYKTQFSGADLRFQKALVLVTRRSQNLAKITAGKFAEVSLVTFAWILRTSYSAFMVVQTRQGNKRG